MRRSSLSRRVITDLLRGGQGFSGLVMTDDLDMGAILNEVTFEQAIQQAILAGNDMVMICHRIEMVEQAYEHLKGLPELNLQLAQERMQRAKGKLSAPKKWSLEEFNRINEDIQQLRVDVLGEEGAANLSVEDGKRSPVELY